MKRTAKALLAVVMTVCMLCLMLPVYADGDAQATSFVTAPATADKWDGDWTGADMEWAGTGTKADPYLISSADELAGLAMATAKSTSSPYLNVYFKLTTDINLAGDEGKEFAPIGIGGGGCSALTGGTQTGTRMFKGNFDGDGHTIYNIRITNSAYAGNCGLFGNIKGEWHLATDSAEAYAEPVTVKNLNMIGGYLAGTRVAPIVSLCQGTLEVENCYTDVDLTVTGSTIEVAGVVGQSRGYTLINNCVAEGDITVTATNGNWKVAGIIAVVTISDQTNNAGSVRYINNCAYTGNISVTCSATTSTSIYAGQIAGQCQNGVSIDNCNAYGTCTYVNEADPYDTENRVGNFIGGFGYAQNNSGLAKSTITNSVCLAGDLRTVGATSNSDITGLRTITETADLGMKLKAVQSAAASDGVFHVRFISTIDSLAYEQAGYIITATHGSTVKNFTNADNSTVYGKIYGNTDTGLKEYTAESLGGSYIVALSGLHIPATGTVTFKVTPVVRTQDSQLLYGATTTLTFTDGAYVGSFGGQVD